MLFLDITGKEVQVKPDRGQTGMTEDLLEAEDVTTVKQVVFGEGVAKRVWRPPYPGNASPLTGTPQHLLYTAPGEGPPLFAEKEPGNFVG